MPRELKGKKREMNILIRLKKGGKNQVAIRTYTYTHTHTHTAYQTDETRRVSKSKERLYFVMRNERGIYRLIYIHKRLDL